jgi:aminopeptidase
MTEKDRFAVSIERLLRDFIHVHPETRALFVFPPIFDSLAIDFLKIASSHCQVSTADSDQSFGDLYAKLLENEVIVFLEKTSSTHAQELSDFLLSHNTKKAYRLFDFSRELLLGCFNCDRPTLHSLNHSLISLANETAVVTVKSEIGTDLRICLDQRFGWINSLGRYAVGRPGILPPSEVATFSTEVDGILVADGAINYNLGVDFDPRLRGRPIFAEFDKGRVKSAKCEDPFIHRLLELFFCIEFSERVGEIGFGTNLGLANFVPFVSHINERYPSFHLGLGSNNQGISVAGWQGTAHLDLILDNCDIWFDGTLVHTGRDYCIERRSDINHTIHAIDHDTF